MSAWITAHEGLLVIILGAVVTLDHFLASTNLFGANSTGQAVLSWIATLAGWGQTLLTPPTTANAAPSASPTNPSAPAVPASEAAQPATPVAPASSSSGPSS